MAFASGFGPRIGVVQRVHVGEDEEELGVDLARDIGRELVVVAEGVADLGGGHDVVLVEDGYRARLEEGLDRGAQVEVGGAVVPGVAGDEELGGGEAEDAEGAAVLVHEGDLADGRAGLAHPQLGHAPRDAQLAGAHAYGARSDDDDLLACARELGDLRGGPVQVLDVDPALGRLASACSGRRACPASPSAS